MDPSLPDNKLTSIQEALYDGQKIRAIKIYRRATGAGLAEAKSAVEKLEADLRSTSPEKFTTRRTGGGCLGAVAVCGVLIGIVLWNIVR